METLRLTGRTMTPRRTQAHSDRPPAVAQPIRPPTHQRPGQSRGRKHMDSSLSVPKHQSTIVKSHVGPTPSRKDSVRLRGSSKQSRDGREEKKKSALTKLVGPTSSTKLQLARDVAGCKQFRDEEGDSQTAVSMNHKQQPQRPSMKRAGGTQQRKKVGPACESQRSVYYSNKKLPPSEFPSPTSSSYTMTETTEESASQSSSPTLPSQRTSKQPWMRKKKSLGKYYSSSSSYSSSSPRWLVSRPAWSLRRRPRAVREEPAEKRRGRLRRFKDKLAVIFHNHHHHHHHYHRGGDSDVESPTTPSKDDPHLPSAATVVRKGPRRRHHGHGLYTLLQRLLRHVWHSGMEEEKLDDRRDETGKKGGRLVGAGSNGWWMQGAAAAGAKLGSRKKKPRLGLGFPKTQRSKGQAL